MDIKSSNQWQNTSLERRDILMPTTHHHGLTPCTSFGMQNTANKGTILNSCCMLFLTVFLPKLKSITTKLYCPSHNNKLWRSITSSIDQSTYTPNGIIKLVIHKWESLRKVYSHKPNPPHIRLLPKYINAPIRLPILL